MISYFTMYLHQSTMRILTKILWESYKTLLNHVENLGQRPSLLWIYSFNDESYSWVSDLRIQIWAFWVLGVILALKERGYLPWPDSSFRHELSQRDLQEEYRNPPQENGGKVRNEESTCSETDKCALSMEIQKVIPHDLRRIFEQIKGFW